LGGGGECGKGRERGPLPLSSSVCAAGRRWFWADSAPSASSWLGSGRQGHGRGATRGREAALTLGRPRLPARRAPAVARQRRRARLPADPPRYERDDPDAGIQADRRLSTMGYPRALVIGSAQILALLAGISRDGVAMVAGMARGLSREDAARFAFLLATPVILA